jgi:acyl-CoA thioesterase FadM
VNLYLRLLRHVLRAMSAPRIGLLESSVIPARVWPTDVDFNIHMNNGRYLTVADVARMHHMTRVGMMGTALKEKWRPIVTGASVRYAQSLTLFQRYDVLSRIVGWTEFDVFLEHEFQLKGRTAAVLMIRGVMLGPRGKVPTRQMVSALGYTGSAPSLPDRFASWTTAATEPRRPSSRGVTDSP